MTNVYELHGTRDRRKRAAPQPPIGSCPAGESPEVRAKWGQFRREFPSLARSDRAALLSLCRVAVEADRAAVALAAAGSVQIGSKGQPVASAQFRVWARLQSMLDTQLGRFGATPVRRASVPPTAPPDLPGSEHLTG